MMRRASLALGVAVLVLQGSFASAEDNAQFRTAVSVTGGLSVGSLGGASRFGGDIAERFGLGRDGSGAGLAVGGTISRDVTPRLTVEASGAYLDRQWGGWSTDLGLRLNLRPASSSMVPYFAVSGGLIGGNSTRIDLDELGSVGETVKAYVDPRIFLPGRGNPSAPFNGLVGLFPDVATAIQQGSSLLSGGSYTNGMLTMGGGVRFDAGPHVFVRPDARAQLVFSDNTRVLGLFTLNFGYRF